MDFSPVLFKYFIDFTDNYITCFSGTNCKVRQQYYLAQDFSNFFALRPILKKVFICDPHG